MSDHHAYSIGKHLIFKQYRKDYNIWKIPSQQFFGFPLANRQQFVQVEHFDP